MIPPRSFVNGGETQALKPGRCKPEERTSVTHWMGRKVTSSAGRYGEKWNFCPRWDYSDTSANEDNSFRNHIR